MPIKRTLPSSFLILALLLGLAAAVRALDYPLSSTAIRDAYFIGTRNDDQTADFLSRYTRRFNMPKSGPYVQEIGLDTPFTQIIRHTQAAFNYHAPDAVQEFQGKPLTLCVHVDISLTPSYSPIPEMTAGALYQWVPAFWTDFKVRLIQDKEIPSRNVRGGPVYAYPYPDEGIPYVTGARIELDYDSTKIDSAPLTVEVLTPDGQKVEAPFDLSRLR